MMTLTEEERIEIAKAKSAARSRTYRERQGKKKKITIAKAKSAANSRRYTEGQQTKSVLLCPPLSSFVLLCPPI
jgi:hypothetical protein